jgi:enamine deaminase RidA (YjgF/YER057c/UK114 family)
MSEGRVRIVSPAALAPAVGFAHGAIATGTMLFVGGQVGVDLDGKFADGFVAQFQRALGNVLAVVAEAGGRPHDLARMTVYVKDVGEYRRCRSELKAMWQTALGRHYPAMALVGVTELVDPEALVEIEAIAALPDRGT